MPDDKPSSAPDDGLLPADDLRAAAILSEDEKSPGGGGLMGANAAAAPSTGGTARNAPIDVPTPTTDRDGAAQGESVAAAGEEAEEPRLTSQ